MPFAYISRTTRSNIYSADSAPQFRRDFARDLLIRNQKCPIIIRLSGISCTQTRDRTGMDFTPLVFETSASTDSAIWAFAVQSYTNYLAYANF